MKSPFQYMILQDISSPEAISVGAIESKVSKLRQVDLLNHHTEDNCIVIQLTADFT